MSNYIDNNIYDTAIIGGGLAGLALSIQLAKKGYRIILFEKETYPFHKVCGEYISMESFDFINSLGVNLDEINVPHINKLVISAPNGKTIEHTLPLGGFGISRYTLDDILVKIARSYGVDIKENTKVIDVNFDNEMSSIYTNEAIYKATVCCGSFGKRSNLDVKWKRSFTLAKKNNYNNYVGIKHHIITDLPIDTIALHNFKNGYCGVSKIEENKYCLCYLTTAKNLKNNNGNIKLMEEKVLAQNPYLKKIFSTATFTYDAPLTISQISFDTKNQVEAHILMMGDAAGMITPLCGNGMSMALHGSKIAFEAVNIFLQNNCTRAEMENNYTKKWTTLFHKRIKTGRVIQQLFGNKFITNVFITILKPFPKAVNYLIRQTHGSPF